MTTLLEKKRENLLSVFFTAGFPELDSMGKTLRSLQENGIDFAEIGMPFSDPLADGPVIQRTNTVAIRNGMNLELLFRQLEGIQMEMPLILMGYLNPVLQFGVESFCRRAAGAGVSGVILPDLPPDVYEAQYRDLFLSYGLHFVFLITPTTDEARIRKIDALSTAFIYAVSSSSITGKQGADEGRKRDYLLRLHKMDLMHPLLVGFGVRDKASFDLAREFTAGAIIGTAFLNARMEAGDEDQAVKTLLRKLNGKP